MRSYLVALISSLSVIAVTYAATPSADIGRAELITNEVTGALPETARKLHTGDRIHQNEVITTAEKSEAELVLADETKLAVGPKSQIVLDSFIYDPRRKDGEVVINAAKGAFRFVTGKSVKSAYTIKTPVSTIGVRGTTFDDFVDDSGEIALLLLDGEIDVCNTARVCKRLNRRGYFLHITRGGIISDPRKWDGTFLGHVDLGHAFPFIGRQLRISPRIRIRHADLLGGRLLPRGAVPGVRPPRIVPKVVPRPPRIRSPF